MMIPSILPDLLDPIELFEENKERKGMRESHRRERNSLMNGGCEDAFVYSIGSSDYKDDIWVGYFRSLDHFGKRFSGKNLGSDITVHDESFLFLEELTNPLTLFLADKCRILGFFRLDVFHLDYFFQATNVFFDWLAEVGGGIGNSNDGNHRTNGYKKILSLKQKDFLKQERMIIFV